MVKLLHMDNGGDQVFGQGKFHFLIDLHIRHLHTSSFCIFGLRGCFRAFPCFRCLRVCGFFWNWRLCWPRLLRFISDDNPLRPIPELQPPAGLIHPKGIYSGACRRSLGLYDGLTLYHGRRASGVSSAGYPVKVYGRLPVQPAISTGRNAITAFCVLANLQNPFIILRVEQADRVSLPEKVIGPKDLHKGSPKRPTEQCVSGKSHGLHRKLYHFLRIRPAMPPGFSAIRADKETVCAAHPGVGGILQLFRRVGVAHRASVLRHPGGIMKAKKPCRQEVKILLLDGKGTHVRHLSLHTVDGLGGQLRFIPDAPKGAGKG
nr:MAG TPA: hypothetical protein [Caudoviricetes sp.]